MPKPEVVSKCPHVISVSNALKSEEILQNKSKPCAVCNYTGSSRWICLQNDCFHVGCGNAKHDHAGKHALENNHELQLNLKNYRVWCNICDFEVFVNNQPEWNFLHQFLATTKLDPSKNNVENCSSKNSASNSPIGQQNVKISQSAGDNRMVTRSMSKNTPQQIKYIQNFNMETLPSVSGAVPAASGSPSTTSGSPPMTKEIDECTKISPKSNQNLKQSVVPYPKIDKICIADETVAVRNRLLDLGNGDVRYNVISDNMIPYGATPNVFAAGRLYRDREQPTAVPYYMSESVKDYQVPGLVGLRNLGNTCYMNAVLQALSNSPPLTDYMLNCHLPIDYRYRCLALVYQKLMSLMWADDKRPAYLIPYDLLQIMRSTYPSFRGFQQQDAQEFLRCFLDALHEDMCQPVYEWELQQEDDNELKRGRVSSEDTNKATTDDNEYTTSTTNSSIDDEAYRTCDSGCSSDREVLKSRHNNETSIKKRRAVKSECFISENLATNGPLDESFSKNNLSKKQQNQLLSHKSAESIDNFSNSCNSAAFNQQNNNNNSCNSATINTSSEFAECRSEFDGSLSSNFSSKRALRRRTAVRCSPERVPRKRPVRFRSIVSDVFDGRLLSSVQCLTCNTISETRETFQDLSLPIPSREHLEMLKSSRRIFSSPSGSTISTSSSANQFSPSPNSTNQLSSADSSVFNSSNDDSGWLSWAYSWFKGWFRGPTITLEDCLAAFFSADDLKGDDMYSCDRCKKLRNGLKYCSLLRLPEILCIHLKRFRHESIYSTKIATSVVFPLENLSLSNFVHNNSKDEVQNYDLVAVISHRGSVEGGHYTAYCLNPLNLRWYEFDDQYATEVDVYTVKNAEAYVLFYRKCSDKIDRLRNDVVIKLESMRAKTTKFYISREWLHRFNTFAEPGPITNFDFLCPHGWIEPSKAENLSDLYAEIPDKIWHILYKQFGGGPVCFQLRHCFECQQQRIRMMLKRKGELDALNTKIRLLNNSYCTF